MTKGMIVVESPTKVKTLQKFLGDDYIIKASVGHVKDLPEGELGVDIEKDFHPQYVTIAGKKKVLGELKKASQKVKNIYLGPDPDREGEAIAWHIAEEIDGKDKNIYRVLFNEITKNAVLEALKKPGSYSNRNSRPSRPGGFWIVWWGIRSALFSGRRCDGD